MTEPRALLLGVAAYGAILACSEAALATETSVDKALQARLESIAAQSGGALGVFAEDLATGRTASVRARERFPMASTYKVPIALAVLEAVERGRLRLDQTVEIRKDDLAPGFSPIVEEWNPGMTRTAESLLRSMVVESDNTACDVLLAAVGGPAAVSGRLRALGIADMDVNRTEAQMAADFHGTTLPARHDVEVLADGFRDTPEATRAAAVERFARDPRDTTTPAAMGRLLARIADGTAGAPESLGRLRAWMRESRSPGARLVAGLPEGAILEHKTGTCASGFAFSCFNDVGLVTLSRGRPPVVIAAFLKSSRLPAGDRNRVLADVARAIVEAWSR